MSKRCCSVCNSTPPTQTWVYFTVYHPERHRQCRAELDRPSQEVVLKDDPEYLEASFPLYLSYQMENLLYLTAGAVKSRWNTEERFRTDTSSPCGSYVNTVNTLLDAHSISYHSQSTAGSRGRIWNIQKLPWSPELRGSCPSSGILNGFDTWWGEFLNLQNPSCRTRPWSLLSL
jgi:hypothetical protein